MNKDFEITRGKTFQQRIRWETPPYIYKPITSISQGAPAIVVATAHGVPDGWRIAVVSAKGMTKINASNNPPETSDYLRATVIDADTIELNDVNSADYKPHIASTGFVQYLTPMDLAGFTARMQIKNKVGGNVLASSLAGDSPLDVITIAIDNAEKTITVTISATATAAFAWSKGVYDLEMVSGTGVVTALLSGIISISTEVTT